MGAFNKKKTLVGALPGRCANFAKFCWQLYFSVINIIVLLNLLIAMMNHSYQLISVSSVGPSSIPNNNSVFPISQTCCFNVLASTLSSQLMYYFSPPFHFTSSPCPSYMYVYRSLSLSTSSQCFNRLFTSNIQKYKHLPTQYSSEIFIYNLCNSLDWTFPIRFQNNVRRCRQDPTLDLVFTLKFQKNIKVARKRVKLE